MRIKLFLSTLILLFGSFNLTTFAQTVKPSVVTGEVSAISSEKIVLKTKDGELDAVLSDKTQYFRVSPENRSLKAATASTFAEISAGDSLVVTGILADDKKTIPARAVYLMSKSDEEKRQAKSKEDWKTRGTVGKVVSYNPQTSAITVSTTGFAGEKTITVKPKENAEFYRYAPDSIEFSKAVKSKISDVEANDEIRILGDKNTEGTEIQAEMIVTGGFKTNGGTIKAIDVAKNEIIISDFQTKKDVAIVVSDFSILKQFPAEMAERLARFRAMQAAGGGFRPPTPQGNQQTPPTPNGQQNPQTLGQTPNGAGQGGGFRAGGGGGLDESRFQNIKVADLKVGEMIGVLSTKTADPTRIKAIKLFSGVEPFIKMSQAMPTRQGSGGGGGQSLSIPGLDGFGGN